jgi:hypothetical protein
MYISLYKVTKPPLFQFIGSQNNNRKYVKSNNVDEIINSRLGRKSALPLSIENELVK